MPANRAISVDKACAKCGETKPADSFLTGRLACKSCRSMTQSRYRKKNAEKISDRAKKYAAANKEKILARQYAWRKENIDKVKAQLRDRYKNNKDQMLAYQSKWRAENPSKSCAIKKKWRDINPQKQNALTAKRRANKFLANVAWADGFIISEMYDLAKRRTRSTGITWQVDHIVPLQSKIVCGLHAHTNMRVITKAANIKKSNRVWEGMP